MKTFVIALALVVIAAAVVNAQDARSLLRQLQEETRELAQATEGVVVPVVVDGNRNRGAAWGTWHDLDVDKHGQVDLYRNAFHKNAVRSLQATGRLDLVLAGHSHSAPVSGVLVGSPARLVVPYAAVGKAAVVHVGLEKGRKVEAKRIDGDAELGVVVYALPKKDSQARRGLEVEGDWDQLRAGTLAVASGGGGQLGLTLLHGADVSSGRVEPAGAVTGAALVGPGKKLLGLRTTAAATDCTACHLPADPAMKRDPLTVATVDGKFRSIVRQPSAYVAWGSAAHGPAATADRSGFVAGPVIARVIADIEEHGRIRHSYLGVILGETVGTGDAAGVMITAVLDGSPAQAAGLAAGERVTAVDGIACSTATALSRALVVRRPTDTITLSLAPKNREVEVELADRAAAQKDFVTPEGVGLGCVDLTPGLRAWLALAEDMSGVVVQSVQPGSSAAKAGLKRGDVIIGGGGGGIADLEELNAALAGAKGAVELRWLRKGSKLAASMKVEGAKGTR